MKPQHTAPKSGTVEPRLTGLVGTSVNIVGIVSKETGAASVGN